MDEKANAEAKQEKLINNTKGKQDNNIGAKLKERHKESKAREAQKKEYIHTIKTKH